MDEVKNVVEGAGGSVQEFLSPFDPAQQFRQVQDATASGQYDAFVISALDGVSIEPAIKEAVSKGIQVVAISTVVGPEQETTEVQVDGMAGAILDPPVRRGEWLGGLATKACEGIDPCKVILEPGSLKVPIEKLFMDEATKVMDKTPSIEVVAQIATELQASVAAKATAEVLQAHPDVNVFAADSDQSIAGTVIALKNAGISVGTGEGEVRVVGLGASAPGVEGVRDGEWFGTVLSLPADEGRIGAETALKAVNGELKAPTQESASEESGIDPELTEEVLPAGFEGQWAG
jgi:ABC-type sugar transport system substrate-binding protein